MVSFATERDRIGAIQQLISNPGWTQWLQPVLMERMKQTMEALASAKSDKDDIQRGWFNALRWVLNLPTNEIDSFNQSEREQSKVNELAADDDHRARYGFRSPYKQAPAPGETKSDDSTSSQLGV